jgi:hypothetical protein
MATQMKNLQTPWIRYGSYGQEDVAFFNLRRSAGSIASDC